MAAHLDGVLRLRHEEAREESAEGHAQPGARGREGSAERDEQRDLGAKATRQRVATAN